MHGFLHQEERFGGYTSKEYTEVRGTENAYVSALGVGMSMRIASNHIQSNQHSPEARSDDLTLFLIVRSHSFYADKLVPFGLSFLIQ